MYYEEKWINNILHCRNDPEGEWEKKLYALRMEAEAKVESLTKNCTRKYAYKDTITFDGYQIGRYPRPSQVSKKLGQPIAVTQEELDTIVRMGNLQESRKEIPDAYLGDFTDEEWDNISKGRAPKPKYNSDPVNHPSHYTNHPSGVECIDITKHMNFCRGNAIKYIWRAGEKGDLLEDLKKAEWYIRCEIERVYKELNPSQPKEEN